MFLLSISLLHLPLSWQKRQNILIEFIKKNYLFIWLCQVLVAACVISVFTEACGFFSCGMWDLVPWPGIELRPPALGAQSLSHWTTRDVPSIFSDSMDFTDCAQGERWSLQQKWVQVALHRHCSPGDETWGATGGTWNRQRQWTQPSLTSHRTWNHGI